MNELNTLAMRKAIVLRIQVPALIHDGLQTFVIDHRVHAVLIGQREVKKLQFNWDRLLPTISVEGDLPSINISRKISIGVDFDPNSLVLRRCDAKGKATTASLCVLGNQLDRLPPQRVF